MAMQKYPLGITILNVQKQTRQECTTIFLSLVAFIIVAGEELLTEGQVGKSFSFLDKDFFS